MTPERIKEIAERHSEHWECVGVVGVDTDIRCAIKQALAECDTGWISVLDELPDNKNNVLGVIYNYEPFKCFYDLKTKMWRLPNLKPITGVHHWRNLPLPPSAKLQEKG